MLAPSLRQLPLKRMFEDGLAVGLELLARGCEGFDALVEFGEQFFDLGDDSALFVKGRNRKRESVAPTARTRSLYSYLTTFR